MAFPSAPFPQDVSGTAPYGVGGGVNANSFVCADFAAGGNRAVGNYGNHHASLWTPGATLAIPIQFQQPPNENWSIIAWSITIGLALMQWADIDGSGPNYLSPAPSFGKLGKIWTGLLVRSSLGSTRTNMGGFITNAIQPFTPLPSDTTLLQTIFDPDTDDLPPATFGFSPPNPLLTTIGESSSLTATNVLSQPIDVQSEIPIGLLLTMLPSLVQNAELWVTALQYTLKLSSAYAY